MYRHRCTRKSPAKTHKKGTWSRPSEWLPREAKVSPRRDSNPQPPDPKSDDLSIDLRGLVWAWHTPDPFGVKSMFLCMHEQNLPNWRLWFRASGWFRQILGFPTKSDALDGSITESLPTNQKPQITALTWVSFAQKENAHNGAWTHDQWLIRPTLYQLSYASVKWFCAGLL